MSERFINVLEREDNFTTTENGLHGVECKEESCAFYKWISRKPLTLVTGMKAYLGLSN